MCPDIEAPRFKLSQQPCHPLHYTEHSRAKGCATYRQRRARDWNTDVSDSRSLALPSLPLGLAWDAGEFQTVSPQLLRERALSGQALEATALCPGTDGELPWLSLGGGAHLPLRPAQHRTSLWDFPRLRGRDSCWAVPWVSGGYGKFPRTRFLMSRVIWRGLPGEGPRAVLAGSGSLSWLPWREQPSSRISVP